MRHGLPFVEVQDNLVRLAALKNDSYMMNPTWRQLSHKLPKKDVRPEHYNEFTKQFLNYVKDINEMEDVIDFIRKYEEWDGKAGILLADPIAEEKWRKSI